MALPHLEDYFPDWKEREALAEAMIPIIGKLYRKNVVVYCYGRALHNKSVTDIMKSHRFVRQVAENELSEFESYPILDAMSQLDIGPSHIDVGRLAVDYMERTAGGETLSPLDYVREACASVLGRHVKPLAKPRNVVLFGFGRIGRLLARLLIEKTGGGDQLILRAIVLRPGRPGDIDKRAALLRRDSVHGAFQGTIRVDHENQCLIVNGNVVRMIYAEHRSQIDYTRYGIDDAILIDNSGIWRDEAGLSEHLQSKGVERVLVTAPGKGNLKNIVSGVNSHLVSDADRILSCGSCTTNAIVPVLKAVNDHWGIVHGHMETIHAYTPDQNLHDNYHRSDRRGRSAPLNMVITETGASRAIAKLLPELNGKLTGNAIRVPTPNVSLVVLNLTLKRDTDRDAVNAFMRDTALYSSLQRQIDYTSSKERVSSDFIGNRHACSVDGGATVAEGNRIVLYAWYDNEFGYACQVVRVLQKWAGIRYPLIPGDVMKTGFDELRTSVAAG